jgi:hypothetical protein
VYTLKGERVFTGLIRNTRWTTAAGDYVYGLGRDPITDETTVNRYRVLIPEGGP